MQTAIIDRVRDRAYAIWQEEGMTAGRHLEHWIAAEREILGHAKAGPKKAEKPRKGKKATALA